MDPLPHRTLGIVVWDSKSTCSLINSENLEVINETTSQDLEVHDAHAYLVVVAVFAAHQDAYYSYHSQLCC